MTIDIIFVTVAGMAISAFTILQMHKKHVDGEIDKAKEKSAGAKAIAEILTRLNAHEGRLEKIENEYVDTLKDAFNHYIKK